MRSATRIDMGIETRKNTFRKVLWLAAGVGMAIASVGAGTAGAVPAITEPVNIDECSPDAPVLLNGSFERFSDPDELPDLVTGTGPSFGFWHGYAGGPNQILFLKPGAGSWDSEHYVRGWKSTEPYIEIQRQVESYTSSVNVWGDEAYSGPARSGVATSATTAAGGAYFDRYAPQPAHGDFWAELNAHRAGALYQDIDVPTSARIFWSLKHRGRRTSQDVMVVKIGPPGQVAVQTALQRFLPTNPDKFSGAPTYGSSTSVSQISTTLSDGWVRYEGTYAPAVDQSEPLRELRFQFEASNGASVGNLLDDIEFTPLYACPVVREVKLGDTDTLDVTGRVEEGSSSYISYGLRHSLEATGNALGPASSGALPTVDASAEFSVSGDDVVFTPTTTGRYQIDYQVTMAFAGSNYSVASRIYYEVSGDADGDGKPDGLTEVDGFGPVDVVYPSEAGELSATGVDAGGIWLAVVAVMIGAYATLNLRRRPV